MGRDWENVVIILQIVAFIVNSIWNINHDSITVTGFSQNNLIMLNWYNIITNVCF